MTCFESDEQRLSIKIRFFHVVLYEQGAEQCYISMQFINKCIICCDVKIKEI